MELSTAEHYSWKLGDFSAKLPPTLHATLAGMMALRFDVLALIVDIRSKPLEEKD